MKYTKTLYLSFCLIISAVTHNRDNKLGCICPSGCPSKIMSEDLDKNWMDGYE